MTVPLALSALLIDGGATIVNVTVAEPVPTLLVALKITLKVPEAVGVPEIKPDAVFTVRPAGSPVAL